MSNSTVQMTISIPSGLHKRIQTMRSMFLTGDDERFNNMDRNGIMVAVLTLGTEYKLSTGDPAVKDIMRALTEGKVVVDPRRMQDHGRKLLLEMSKL